MASKPISLTVHRTSGYALILWTDDGEADAYWDRGGGETFITERVNQIMRRKVGNLDAAAIVNPEQDTD